MFSIAAATAVVATLANGVRAVPCSTTCYYEITAEMAWTAARHPTDYPVMTDATPGAFFPNFWTVAHDESFTFWKNGETANPGIQEIAEAGSGEAFMAEVAACGDSCGMGEGFPCEPMAGDCEMAGLVKVTSGYPYISTATMLAPSPDWFTGLSSLGLCVDGEWMESYETEVFPYDGGTDSGVTFLSEDAVTSPFEPIRRFGADDEGIFYNPDEGATLPIGTIGVHMVKCDGDDDVMPMDDGMYGGYGSYGM